ncbi:MAG: hypothetical protein AAGB02_00165 [Pseudomonadota bacterium]
MSFFLFKPHVEGLTGDITTPDIIIDRLLLSDGGALNPIPSRLLSSAAEIGIEGNAATAFPAYMLAAAGGGVIISPAIIVRSEDATFNTTSIHIARMAWRWKNVSGHADKNLFLSVLGAETTICNLGDPRKIIEEVHGAKSDELPRGVAVLCFSKSCSVDVQGAVRLPVTMKDSALDRSLVFPFDLDSAAADPWPERPLPRYSVGPQEDDVKHYI